jgi:protease I
MSMQAKDKSIAALLPNYFDAKQFNAIKDCIVKAGGNVIIMGFRKGETLTDKTRKQVVTIEMATEDIDIDDYSAVVILDSSTPEEVKASRRNLNLIIKSYEHQIVVGATDRGVELLVAALGSLMKGRKVTGPVDSRIYLEGAGATFLDQEVVVDGTLITARSSTSTEEFCKVFLAQLGLAGGIAA